MKRNMQNTLVLGGCRSGKSSYALELAGKISEKNRLYIATCVPYDNEMKDRVDRHQAERDETWVTVETPIKLSESISENNESSDVILIDCLTLWITNLLLDGNTEDEILAEVKKLEIVLKNSRCPVVLVSNEVGAGIVPENKLARQFRDIAGFANQRIARCVNNVFFTAAGIPLKIKG